MTKTNAIQAYKGDLESLVSVEAPSAALGLANYLQWSVSKGVIVDESNFANKVTSMEAVMSTG